MKLAQGRASLKRNLSGSSTAWSDELLDGAIARAVEDLDRLYPQEKLDGVTLIFDIDDEVWDSGTLGSTVSLSNTRLRPKSETVTDTTGATTYTRDTDYTMDYALGTIIALASGSIPGSQADLLISYKILEVYIDISSLTDLIRVVRVEYPAGNIPADFQSFYTWGDHIVLTSLGTESQQRLTEKEHAWVYYYAKHTLPTPTVDGSWKPPLDEVIIKGAEAYSLMTKALEVRHSAQTRLSNALTVLEDVGEIEAKIDTALAETFTQASSASDDLENVQQYIDDMVSILAAVGSYLALASEAVVNALARAEEAEDKIGNADSELESANSTLVVVNRLIDQINDLISSAKTSTAEATQYFTGVSDDLTEVLTSIQQSTLPLLLSNSSLLSAKAKLESGSDVLGLGGGAEFYVRSLSDIILNTLDSNINNPSQNVADNITAAGNELINAVSASDRVNVGEIVSEMHRRIGDTWLTAARIQHDSWLTWLGRVDRRLAQGGHLITIAGEYRLNADSYINEANVILGEINSVLGQISAHHTQADKNLDVGRGFIAEGQNYVGAANAATGSAGRGIEQANAYVNIAKVRLETADQDSRLVESYISASNEYVKMAQAKIAEANAFRTPVDAILERVGKKIEVAKVYQQEADRRIQQIALRHQEVDRHIDIAVQELELAEDFEERGVITKTEFMGILTDRAQIRSDTAMVPTRQSK